jgi:hypothetical protein
MTARSSLKPAKKLFIACCLTISWLAISFAQQPAKLPQRPLQKDYVLCSSSDYGSMFLLQGKRLTILRADGTEGKSHDLDKAYKRIADRDDVLVCLSADPKAIDLIDKKSLNVRKSIPLKHADFPFFNVWNLAVHPSKPISYVTINHETAAPGFRVLIIDETSGAIAAPDEMYGTYVAVDPAGELLYVGYRDLARKGFKMPILKGKFVIQSEMGDVNTLFSYKLTGDKATPSVKQIIDKAGGNGQGLQLSPDGARLTYLSAVGYPSFSGNLAGFDAHDLKKQPVTYATKSMGSTTSLTYHPTLKLAAVPGIADPAVFFERETGKQEKDRLNYDPKDFNGVKVEQAFFSADGKRILLDCLGPKGDRYLQPVELRLTPEELKTAAKGYVRPSAKK